MPPTLSAAAFPELPTAGPQQRAKPVVGGNVSLRHILGDAAVPVASAWKANGSGHVGAGAGTGEVVLEAQAQTQTGTEGQEGFEIVGKGKKGKGKQKQTLFTLGSFPT